MVSLAGWGQCDDHVVGPLVASLLGNVLLDDEPVNESWLLVATDGNGACAGKTSMVMDDGTAFFNLAVYGDDPTTPMVDEGMAEGDAIRLELWNEAGELVDVLATASQWSNTNGAPLLGWGNAWQPIHFHSGPTCLGDSNGSGVIDVADLLGFLGKYGAPCVGCLEDLDGSGSVEVSDLLNLLPMFGSPC